MSVNRATRATIAARRAKLVDYRRKKIPYSKFYKELGYNSINEATKDFKRALEESIARQDANVELYREEQLQELEYLAEEVHAIFREEHFVHSAAGKVVLHPDTDEPLHDAQPRLAAADRLLKIAAETAKLRGLHAPTKVEGVFTIDALNDAILDAQQQLAALGDAPGEDAGTEEADG